MPLTLAVGLTGREDIYVIGDLVIDWREMSPGFPLGPVTTSGLLLTSRQQLGNEWNLLSHPSVLQLTIVHPYYDPFTKLSSFNELTELGI
jgi:hypothetical protein